MSFSPTIPFFYRLTFNYLEPLMIVLAGFQAIFLPSSLLETTLPNLSSVLSTSNSSSLTLQTISPLMIQIGGAWLHLGLMDIFVLRIAQDVSVWRACLFASVVSDAC